MNTPALTQAKEQPAAVTTGSKPVHVIRGVHGLQCSIWENPPGPGPRYTAKVVRRYKQGQQWHDSYSLSGAEHLVAAQLHEEAYRWERARRAEASASDSPQD